MILVVFNMLLRQKIWEQCLWAIIFAHSFYTGDYYVWKLTKANPDFWVGLRNLYNLDSNFQYEIDLGVSEWKVKAWLTRIRAKYGKVS